MIRKSRQWLALCASAIVFVAAAGAQSFGEDAGPADQGPQMPQQMGAADLGRDVFRNETFGNEGFWTDAVRLPAGIMAAGVTPMQALELGLQVDADAIDPSTQARLAAELAADPSGRSSTILNDPAMTAKLNHGECGDGDDAQGAKVGATCALCHSMSDGSVFTSPAGGSIGRRQDGLANHSLHLGEIFATAANTRALYTVAQLQLTANKGKTLGRAARGLDEKSSEAAFDAYFRDHRNYPVGMFDDSFDGNGNPMHNTPLFRQDLAAPYGSEGTFTKIDDFSNLVFTSLFDQTMLTTPGGRKFVKMLAGPAGDEMIADYVKILSDTGVTGYPFVRAQGGGTPGALATPIGFRVNNRRLLAMNSYVSRLQAPAGTLGDPRAAARGERFSPRQAAPAATTSVRRVPCPPRSTRWREYSPGDQPVTLAMRKPPLNPVLDTPGSFFDDKMAVVNASMRGEKRGVAMPLLLDLARKPTFLHDDSVKSFAELLDETRGRSAPHPFFVKDARRRSDLIAYLYGLDSRGR